MIRQKFDELVNGKNQLLWRIVVAALIFIILLLIPAVIRWTGDYIADYKNIHGPKINWTPGSDPNLDY